MPETERQRRQTTSVQNDNLRFTSRRTANHNTHRKMCPDRTSSFPFALRNVTSIEACQSLSIHRVEVLTLRLSCTRTGRPIAIGSRRTANLPITARSDDDLIVISRLGIHSKRIRIRPSPLIGLIPCMWSLGAIGITLEKPICRNADDQKDTVASGSSIDRGVQAHQSQRIVILISTPWHILVLQSSKQLWPVSPVVGLLLYMRDGFFATLKADATGPIEST